MANEHLEQLYNALLQSTQVLQKAIKSSMIDALVEVGDDLQAGDIHQEDGLPNAETSAKLTAILKLINLNDYSAEEIRMALQLVLIKASEHDNLEPNQQVTPDALATLASFIITTMMPNMGKKLQIADIAAGTGNLLFAVMNALQANEDVAVKGYALDNNESLLSVASMSSALQNIDVELYHQDSIDPLPFKDVDVVLSDLPVGYYPIDERAKGFATAAKKGHSYAHHLLMEQGLNGLRPGGLGLFFVPSSVFKSDEAKGLTAWLASSAYFQGLLGLPESFFSTKSAEKSLLVIQKPGNGAKQAPQVLLGQFPELNDRAAFTKFIDDVTQWYHQNIN